MDMVTPAQDAAADDEVRAYTAEELKAAVLAKLKFVVGKDPVAASQRDWFLSVAAATRDIVVERWIASTNRNYEDHRKRVYYLSLEFLIGRMLYRRDDQSRHRRADDGGDGAAWRRSQLAAARRGGRGARQWRPRAAGGLLHGYRWRRCRSPPTATASATTTACSADHPQRLAAGGAGGLAARTATPGSSSAPRSITPSASAAGSRPCRARTTRCATSGTPANGSRRSPSTRRSSAGAAATSTRCGCGRRARPIR